MLTKLALKNLRYYAQHYLIYLITICFLSWAYYTFISFSQGDYMQVLQQKEAYQYCFKIGYWMLLFFTAIFVWFSTDFFFQKRKQEFGMYRLMGIKRNTIGYLLVTESVIMGMLAVIGGIAAGILTAAPIQKLVAWILNEDGKISVFLSPGAIGKMLLLFFLVFAVFSFLNYLSVRNSQLVDLFHAKETSEKPLKISMKRFFPSFLLLCIGFILIFQVPRTLSLALLPIGLGCVIAGTYFSFTTGIGYLATKLRGSNRCAVNIAWRIHITGVIHNVRRHTGSWASIALLIAASISALIMAFTSYESTIDMVKEFGDEMTIVVNMTKVLIIVIMITGAALLAATGSILYFRLLSEMEENKHNYYILYCIGATRKELRSVIRKQSQTMFLLPFATGVCYSLLFSFFLYKAGMFTSIVPTLCSIAAYTLIYLVYYLLAAKQGYRLLSEAHTRTE